MYIIICVVLRFKTVCAPPGISDVDTDLEHIFLLAGHLLRTPQADGTVTARNIVTTSSLKECLKTTCCSPLAAFFKDEEALKQHLVTLVLSCANEGPKMKEICSRMLLALEEAPSSFSRQEYNITNLKMRKDIHFENAAVTAASCHGTPDYFIPRYRVAIIVIVIRIILIVMMIIMMVMIMMMIMVMMMMIMIMMMIVF